MADIKRILTVLLTDDFGTVTTITQNDCHMALNGCQIISDTPSPCTLCLYSPPTFAKSGALGAVTMEVYTENKTLLFTGNVTDCQAFQQDNREVVTITTSDGDIFVTHTQVNIAIRKGALLSDVLKTVCAESTHPIALGCYPAALDTIRLHRGIIITGRPMKYVRLLSQTVGQQAYIEHNVLYITGHHETGEAEISQDLLTGTPARTAYGISFHTKLYPPLLNRAVRLANIPGIFIPFQVSCSADTHSGSWECVVQAADKQVLRSDNKNIWR